MRRSIMETKFRVRPSKVHGVGVFALVEIAKDSLHMPVKRRTDFVCKESDLLLLPKEVVALIRDMVVSEDGEYRCARVDWHALDFGHFINASENPNCERVVIGDREWIKTLRRIQPGEELFLEYDV